MFLGNMEMVGISNVVIVVGEAISVSVVSSVVGAVIDVRLDWGVR